MFITPKLNDRQDENKRNAVFAHGAADRIIIMISTARNLGLRPIERDEREMERRRLETAAAKDINAFAYGDKPSSNKLVIQNQSGVSLATFLAELAERGYKYVGGHSYKKEGRKTPTNVLEFYKAPLSRLVQELPAAIAELLTNGAFHQINVWAGGVDERGRIDSVLATDGQKSTKNPLRSLCFAGEVGGTYRVK